MSAKFRSPLRRASTVCFLLVAGAGSAGAQTESPGAASARVVAVGDVHGAFPEFVTILERAGLIDQKLEWTGGSAVLVQTGDVPDRGPGTRAALDLLMRLESQAEKQNGKVRPLLGNHEVMTMTGDLRYVLIEDYRSFSTDQSEKLREQAWEDYKRLMQDPRRRRHGELFDDAAREKWMAEHPLGFFERRDAFAPEGVYGRWLRQHDAIAQIGDVLFMHGGLDPKLHFHNIEELNKRIRSELATFDSLWESLSRKRIIWRYMTWEQAFRAARDQWEAMQSGGLAAPEAFEDVQKFLNLPNGMLMSEDSPLWYRGLALEPEENLRKGLDKMLSRLKVRYIVAAHTVRPKFDITPRFDHRVFLIDTGMLKPYFGGRASALEIQDGRFTAYYADGPQQVLLGPAPTPAQGDGKDPTPARP